MALLTRLNVSTVSIGRIQQLKIGSRLVDSAIGKQPISNDIIEVTELGIAGDEHADPKHHGGPDKAIYIYPFVHYAAWEDDLRLLDGDSTFTTGELSVPSFGENLTVSGMIDETMVRIGDRFAWGDEVVLRVTKPREPCFKFDHLMGVGASDRMKMNGRCGWYCAVERPGMVAIDASLDFIGHDPNFPDLQPTVRDVFYAKVRKPRDA